MLALSALEVTQLLVGLSGVFVRMIGITTMTSGLPMTGLNLTTLRLAAIIFPICLTGCAEKFIASDYREINQKYDVVIERDNLGIPHILGERDVDAAFGFAYAQAEDNWQIIHDTIPFYRGTNAAINGQDAEETGISRPTLTRISNVPGYNTNTDTISALCDYFEIEPGELLKKV